MPKTDRLAAVIAPLIAAYILTNVVTLILTPISVGMSGPAAMPGIGGGQASLGLLIISGLSGLTLVILGLAMQSMTIAVIVLRQFIALARPQGHGWGYLLLPAVAQFATGFIAGMCRSLPSGIAGGVGAGMMASGSKLGGDGAQWVLLTAFLIGAVVDVLTIIVYFLIMRQMSAPDIQLGSQLLFDAESPAESVAILPWQRPVAKNTQQ